MSSRVGDETQQSDLLALCSDVDGWDLYLSSQKIEEALIILLNVKCRNLCECSGLFM